MHVSQPCYVTSAPSRAKREGEKKMRGYSAIPVSHNGVSMGEDAHQPILRVNHHLPGLNGIQLTTNAKRPVSGRRQAISVF